MTRLDFGALWCAVLVACGALGGCAGGAGGRLARLEDPANPANPGWRRAEADGVAQCPRVAACRSHRNCSVCLAALAPAAGTPNPLISPEARRLESAFFALLKNNSACAVLATPPHLLSAALDELASGSLCAHSAEIAVNGCQRVEYGCFAGGGTCEECLTAVDTPGVRPRAALQTPACAAADSAALGGLAAACARFPRCSWAKERCRNATGCAECLVALQTGNAPRAAAECAPHTAEGALLDAVAGACGTGTLSSCTYAWERCEQDRLCGPCLAATGYAHSVPSVINGGNTPACLAVRENASAAALLNRAFDACPATIVDNCQSKIVGCLMADPRCGGCLNQSGAGGDARHAGEAVCEGLLNGSGYGVAAACSGCPAAVGTVNAIVQATSAVGGVSVLACVAAVVVIVVHRRHLVSMRDRVIIGLLLFNAIYASANAIPLNHLSADFRTCGTFTLSALSIRFGRAWWFCGKYGILAFELFILGASIWALTRGARAVPLRVEAAMHALCVLVGVIAFVGFYLRCAQMNTTK